MLRYQHAGKEAVAPAPIHDAVVGLLELKQTSPEDPQSAASSQRSTHQRVVVKRLAGNMRHGERGKGGADAPPPEALANRSGPGGESSAASSHDTAQGVTADCRVEDQQDSNSRPGGDFRKGFVAHGGVRSGRVKKVAASAVLISCWEDADFELAYKLQGKLQSLQREAHTARAVVATPQGHALVPTGRHPKIAATAAEIARIQVQHARMVQHARSHAQAVAQLREASEGFQAACREFAGCEDGISPAAKRDVLAQLLLLQQERAE